MKIKTILFAAMLFNAASYAENVSSQNTTAKNVKNIAALASIAASGAEYLITQQDVYSFHYKVEGEDFKFDIPLNIPQMQKIFAHIAEVPAFLHDVMRAALEDEPSYCTHLNKLAKAIVEGLKNANRVADIKDDVKADAEVKGSDSKDSDSKVAQNWKSSKINQVILSLAFFAETEVLNKFASKTIKNLTGKHRLVRRAMRIAYQTTLKTLIEGGIKPTLQDTKTHFIDIAQNVGIQTFIIEALGELIKRDFELQDEDTKLLEEVVEQIKELNSEDVSLENADQAQDAQTKPLVTTN